MGNEIVKVCKNCGIGVTNHSQLQCLTCKVNLMTIVNPGSVTGIRRRSIQKVCAKCGRTTVRSDRERCKTCHDTSFIQINRIQYGDQIIPQRKRKSFFWGDSEEGKKKKEKKVLRRKEKKTINLMLSLKKSLTDRFAIKRAVEEKKKRLHESTHEVIGDYSDSDEEEAEEIGDWLDEGNLDVAENDNKNSTSPTTPKSKKRLSRKNSNHKTYFDQFPVEIRDTVIKALEKKFFEEGDTIVAQGDEGDCMYVILDGEASISVRDEESGKERLITHIYKGDYFGETSLIYGVRRTATVRAVSKVNCSVLTHEKYQEMPKFRSFLALSKCDITKNFNDELKLALCNCLKPVEFNRGDYVVKEGEVVDFEESAFFMITNGEVEILDLEHGHLVNLRVGHSFGEMALVNDRPRNASVRVVSKFLTCMALSKSDFLNSLDDNTALEEKLVESTRHLEVVRETRLQMLHHREDYADSSSQEHEHIESENPPTPPPGLPKISSVQQFKLRSESYVDTLPTRRSPRHRVGSVQKYVNEYRVLKTLGSGSFADVKLCLHDETKQEYAMKCLKRPRRPIKRSFTSQLNNKDDIMLEIKIMRLLEHPYIVELVDVIEDERYIYLIQELCDGGSIMPDAESPDGAKILSDKTARGYTRQIIRALEYMHECGVIHRDLKPQNILLRNGNIKICDFGTACIISEGETLTVPKGTPAFMAPEILLEETLRYTGPPADIWSLGATLYMMVVGRQPWVAKDYMQLSYKVRHDELAFPKRVSLDPHLRNLITKILTKNPKRRPTLRSLMSHEWITEEGCEPMSPSVFE